MVCHCSVLSVPGPEMALAEASANLQISEPSSQGQSNACDTDSARWVVPITCEPAIKTTWVGLCCFILNPNWARASLGMDGVGGRSMTLYISQNGEAPLIEENNGK